jgi:eukaryotic-like serine/threonine-protein kinase
MQTELNFLRHLYRGNYLMLFSVTILIFNIYPSFTNNNNFQQAFGQFFFNENKHPMLTYESQNLNFKINYPDNWERSSNLNNETIFIAPKETDASSSPAGLVVKVMPIQSKNISIGSISNTLITQLKKAHKDFKLESSGQTLLDSKKSRQVIFTATDNNLQNRKALQIVTINQNNIFIITYKASLDKYAQYENTIKDMISSFKFLKK